MILPAIWCRFGRPDMERIYVPPAYGPAETFLRFCGMPPRFLKLDRRLTGDATLRDCDIASDAQPNSTFTLIGVPYRVIRLLPPPEFAFFCVRDDAWWTRYVARFDRFYAAMAITERRAFYWLMAHGVVETEPGYVGEWLSLPGLRRIKVRRDARRNARFEAAMAKMGIALKGASHVVHRSDNRPDHAAR